MDDMLVKSKDEANHLDDLKETFNTLRKYNRKLNPAKCVFAVASGKFLEFMVSQWGIEANPDKVKAIIKVKSPKIVKEVQSLTRKVAALNRFVSRATDKCIPFFKVLKKAFQWNDECEEALAKLKEYLTKPPLLSPSVIGEKLFLYLVVSNTIRSLALIREEGNIQKPIYYTSQAFQGAEVSYPRMEKIAFTLLVASIKLRPHFQAHPIVVMTNQPIRKTMNKIDVGQLIQWVIELSQFDIEYRPRAAIKPQVLADFIAEFTYPCKKEEPLIEIWTVQTNGLAMKKVEEAGIVLIPPEGETLTYAVRLQFTAINNEVEYKALLIGLSLAKTLRARNLIVQADS